MDRKMEIRAPRTIFTSILATGESYHRLPEIAEVRGHTSSDGACMRLLTSWELAYRCSGELVLLRGYEAFQCVS